LSLVLENLRCDIIEFDVLYKENENQEAWKQALGLYRGPLLMEDFYEWTEVLEAYYDFRYLELLDKLATYYENKGLKKAAEDILEYLRE